MGSVIAISNLKGGIGKTTTVVNLGAGLALKGARVLLVDVDAQGNLAMGLGVQPRRTLYEVLVDGAKAEHCLTPARANLDLLAADHTLLGAQPIIAQRPDWSRVLDHGLRPLFGRYDFILIDSGGSLTPLNINAFVCAQYVIAPTAIEHFSLKSIDLLFQQVARVKGNNSAIRMIVPTMYDPRVKQSGELMEDLRKRYGPLLAPPIRVNVRLSEAPRSGKTIYEYDPRSRGAADYAQLVERVSTMFNYQHHTAPAAAAPRPATVAAPEPAPAIVVQGARPPQPEPQRSVPQPAAPAPTACPNCGRPLRHVHASGYRVDYCEYCHYKAQTLLRELR